MSVCVGDVYVCVYVCVCRGSVSVYRCCVQECVYRCMYVRDMCTGVDAGGTRVGGRLQRLWGECGRQREQPVQGSRRAS